MLQLQPRQRHHGRQVPQLRRTCDGSGCPPATHPPDSQPWRRELPVHSLTLRAGGKLSLPVPSCDSRMAVPSCALKGTLNRANATAMQALHGRLKLHWSKAPVAQRQAMLPSGPGRSADAAPRNWGSGWGAAVSETWADGARLGCEGHDQRSEAAQARQVGWRGGERIAGERHPRALHPRPRVHLQGVQPGQPAHCRVHLRHPRPPFAVLRPAPARLSLMEVKQSRELSRSVLQVCFSIPRCASGKMHEPMRSAPMAAGGPPPEVHLHFSVNFNKQTKRAVTGSLIAHRFLRQRQSAPFSDRAAPGF